ncbi:adenylosuccinate synthase [Halobacteriales archaeon QS_3_64_16]|nr:MAG: adenylosuccinate synthase [Halobacteriales archaeon QS_3_64_16]
MVVTIVGSQLGDEGKGGIVDRWSESADIVVRYQGGDNAGHTVVDGEDTYKLSLVPSGTVRGRVGVLGNGCVVNPETLLSELDALRERGLDPDLKVARRAHVIFPYHCALDGIEERAKEDKELDAGTTGRGIGPTYEDKAGRRGIRIGDLLDPEVLRGRLEYVVPQKRALAESVFGVETGESFDIDRLYEDYKQYGERLREEDMTVNAGAYLEREREAGGEILFEGAQGTVLDIDHGNYPFVTSSNPTAGGASVGSGLGPGVVGQGETIGVVKAYLSRVGTGPLPTELGGVEGQTPGYEASEGNADRDDTDDGEDAEREEALATEIREAGGEYGTVTGRPRRVGWLDLPMLRHAARASSFSGLAINHVDTLAALDSVRVCERYDLAGESLATIPARTERWSRCEPVYREFDGWPDADWERVVEEGYGALPENARAYLEYVSDEVKVPIAAVGVGPGREQTIVLDDPFEHSD